MTKFIYFLFLVKVYSIVLKYDPDLILQTTCTQMNENQLTFNGYLKLNRTELPSALAFIFYGSKSSKTLEDVANTKTIIWLNGGPGESSMVGNFFGIGPILYNYEENKFVTNNKSWNNKYNILFIDQPVGTGFSIVQSNDDKNSDIPRHQDDIAIDFFVAMTEFFTAGCGSLAKLRNLASQDWFLFGQGYAGKYIPAIANQFLENKDTRPFGIKGIALGDPFTNPLATISEMGNFGYARGISTFQERQRNEQSILSIAFNCYYQQWENAHQLFDASLWLDLQSQAGTKNRYNIQKTLEYDKIFQNFSREIQSGSLNLGFLHQNLFYFQNDDVSTALYADYLKNDTVVYLEKVIQSKEHIHVLIFQCQNDLIIPSPGVMRWVYDLQYQYTKEFQRIDFKAWVLSNDIVGFLKRVDNLEFRVILNSGQYSYMDQPDVTLKMIIDFIEQYY